MIYALLTVGMTWPVTARLGTHIPGTLGDAFVHLWTFEWLKQALLTGQNPFYTDLIFYPTGVSLLNHNIAWINFSGWLPLQALFGPEVGYSLAFLLLFPLNGIATYLFLREIGISETAAFIGGLVVAFWPYNLSHHDHPNLILIAWVPLSMLFMHRTQQRRQWRDALLAGIFIALIGLTRWQLLVMAAPLLALYLLFLLLQTNHSRWSLLQRYALVGGVALLLMMPLLVPILSYQITRSDPRDLLVDEEPYPTDLVAYVTPSRYHPLWGNRFRLIARRFAGNNLYVRFVGYTALLLAIGGALSRYRRARFWLLALGVYLLLALGPFLYIAGSPTLPLPYQLIEETFIIQNLRFPDRFNVLLALPFALLVAVGSETLLQTRPLRNHAYLTAILLSVLLLFEYTNQYETLPLTVPDWYEAVAQREDSFAVLDVPAFSEEHFNKQYMYYQLVHRKSMVVGRIARPPSNAFAYIREVPLLHNLLTNKTPPADIPNISQQMSLLANKGVHYLVLHRQHLSSTAQQAWLDWFVRRPVHEDESTLVFSTKSPQIGQELPFKKNVSGDERIGLLSLSFPATITQGQWFPVEVVWGSTQPLNTDLTACLELIHCPSSEGQKMCRPLSQLWPTSRWQRNEIVRETYAIQVNPFAKTGEHQVLLHLMNGETPITTQPVLLGDTAVTPLDRQFNSTTPQVSTSATWNESLTLTGYDLDVTAEQLSIILHWYVPHRVDKSYKMFLHLLDDSGQLTAQVDFIPRDWSYPTNWWAPGEYVTDNVILSLADVPTGTFTLQLGVYDPDIGQRLPLISSSDIQPGNNTFPLTQLERK